MDPKWTRLAARFLDEAADHYSRHGCNDWEWPEGWTDEEKRDFVRQMHEDNGHPEEFRPDETSPPDWWAMSFLARRLEALA